VNKVAYFNCLGSLDGNRAHLAVHGINLLVEKLNGLEVGRFQFQLVQVGLEIEK
jgi:hypothetical protein